MFTIEGMPESWKMRALARFMEKIDDSNGTGCWEWQASFLGNSGYGQFFYGSIGGKERSGKAHKAAWTLLKGPVPEGVFVLHRCHNRKCCNPNHLYLGTHEENMIDKVTSGRAPSGENHYKFKRDEELNSKIGKLRAEGFKIDVICERLNIGRSTYYRCARSGAVDRDANRRARSANASARWAA
jgi:hypothetical protein